MHVWTIANLKGGVGKTTTTVALGGLLSGAGRRVLLIDMDPHASLTLYLTGQPESADGVYAVFQAAAADRVLAPESLVVATRCEGLDLLPASPALATLDRQLVGRRGMGTVLGTVLKPLGVRYDAVLVDCPPTLGILLVSALAACEHVIIPVQTEFLALHGLDRMLHTVGMVRNSRGVPLPHTIVPTMFDRRTRASMEALQSMQSRYQGLLAPEVVPVDTQFREASRLGLPPSLMKPEPRGVGAYRALLGALSGSDTAERRAAVG